MTKKRLVGKFVMTMIFTLAVSTDADANPNSTTGTLTTIETGWGGEGIYLIISPTPSPICNGRIFMPISANQYKENLAIAMLAYAQGLPATVYYNSACDANGNVAFISLTVGIPG
jgi:hypothetical protein